MSRQPDLFAAAAHEPAAAPGLTILRGYALPLEQPLLQAIAAVAAAAPFRHMITPGGQRMSAALTNCGEVGWVSDRAGYRYARCDPQTGLPWPALPECIAQLGQHAAAQCGFAAFRPEVCLINRYAPGARMSLHQDRDERDLSAPIVSISLGLEAIFLFGGLRRCERAHRVPLSHGDVAVWGGAQRLAYHGVAALAEGIHPNLGRMRLNLTLRRAL